MKLYKLVNEERDNTHFYARDPEHIIEVIESFLPDVPDIHRNHPDLVSWLRMFGKQSIVAVEEGELTYHCGNIDLRIDGQFFEELNVTNDFTVKINLESFPYFIKQRLGYHNSKRKHLYTFHSPSRIFQSQNFLPKDIMEAIVQFNIGPYIERIEASVEGINASKQHPNIA